MNSTPARNSIKAYQYYLMMILVFLTIIAFQPVLAIKGTKIKNKMHLHNSSVESQETIKEELQAQEGIVSFSQQQDNNIVAVQTQKTLPSNSYSQDMIMLVQKHASILRTMYFDYYNKLTNKISSEHSSTQIVLEFGLLFAIIAICVVYSSNKLKKPYGLDKQAVASSPQQVDSKDDLMSSASIMKQREQDELFYASYGHNLSTSMEEHVCIGESSILSESDYKLDRPKLDILTIYQQHTTMSSTFPVLKLNQYIDEGDLEQKPNDQSLQLDQNSNISQEVRDLLKDSRNGSFLQSCPGSSMFSNNNINIDALNF